MPPRRRSDTPPTPTPAPAPQERYARQEVVHNLRRLFQRLDANGDGKFDARELRSFLTSMHYKPKKVIQTGCRTAGLPPAPLDGVGPMCLCRGPHLSVYCLAGRGG